MTSPFSFVFGAATADETLYVAGVVSELEDRDVPHTILWERLRGTWRRYQWNNRSYDITAYEHAGSPTLVLLGYDGALKVRSAATGSSVEMLDTGVDAPSSLRAVHSIRAIGDTLFVTGMRRMVYRRPIEASSWDRCDSGVRVPWPTLSISSLQGIDGPSPDTLLAVGTDGALWLHANEQWRELASPTTSNLYSVRFLVDGRWVIGGAGGALWIGTPDAWVEVEHAHRDQTFNRIERWGDRCFVHAEGGTLFELELSARPTLAGVAGVDKASWMFATPARLYVFGEMHVTSLGPDGQRDESPPADLLRA